ncbi:hypothetical protein BC936DRAFT_140407, partial [Jimgerdemannia flammicorona]
MLGEFADVIQGHFTGHTNGKNSNQPGFRDFLASAKNDNLHLFHHSLSLLDDMLSFIVRNQTSTGNYSLITLTGSSLPHIDLSTNPIVTVLNNAPSVIPVNNPALRVYDFETNPHEFGMLVDWTQYYANLTAANNKGKVVWQKEYQALKQYGLKGLFPQDYTKLVQGFLVPNSTTWAAYVKYITVGSGVIWDNVKHLLLSVNIRP